MMAMRAFFCLAGWKRLCIRPADPVKVTAGIGTSLAGGRARARCGRVDVVFTSGGAEASALALPPAIERPGHQEPLARLLVSAIEHPSVRSGGRFAQDSVEEIAVTGDGVADLADLERRLGEPGHGRAL